MAAERLQGKCKGGFRRKTTGGSDQLAANFLDRQFALGAGPNVWVGDITYIPTRRSCPYLATVISVQARQVMGCSVPERMTEELVVKAFANAWSLNPQKPGLIFHSDRGGQYWGNEYCQLLQSHGVVESMSRPGNCWDNAVAQSFFASFINDEADKTYQTRKEARQSIAAYIHGFYNPTRLHSTLGYKSPNDYALQLEPAAWTWLHGVRFQGARSVAPGHARRNAAYAGSSVIWTMNIGFLGECVPCFGRTMLIV